MEDSIINTIILLVVISLIFFTASFVIPKVLILGNTGASSAKLKAFSFQTDNKLASCPEVGLKFDVGDVTYCLGYELKFPSDQNI